MDYYGIGARLTSIIEKFSWNDWSVANAKKDPPEFVAEAGTWFVILHVDHVIVAENKEGTANQKKFEHTDATYRLYGRLVDELDAMKEGDDEAEQFDRLDALEKAMDSGQS